MEKLSTIITIILLIGVLFYVLYINGYMVIKSISAIAFIGSIGRFKNRSKATFLACNGYIKKVIKFKESREYQFIFNCTISKGDIVVEVQNRHKETVLVLDTVHRNGVLDAHCAERYYLILKFKKADGSFELTWS